MPLVANLISQPSLDNPPIRTPIIKEGQQVTLPSSLRIYGKIPNLHSMG